MSEPEQVLSADSSIRAWLADARGSAALASALAGKGLALDTLRPLSGFTLRAVAAMVGTPLEPVDAFVERARTFDGSGDPGAPDHWASTGLGRHPSKTTSV